MKNQQRGVFRVLTSEAIEAFHGNSQQSIMNVAARLEGSSIGVNIDVAHSPLDADAATRGAPGVGVQYIHKLGIVLGQGALDICILKGGTSRVKSCIDTMIIPVGYFREITGVSLFSK